MNIFGLKGWQHQLTKYSPAEAIDSIVKDLAPMFKTEGYKKAGRTWTKDMGEFSFVIGIQGSSWNGKETGAQFSATYGVFIPCIFKAFSTHEQPRHPKSYNCIFGRTLSGTLTHMPWEIFDNTNMEALQASVATQIKEECISIFADISSLEDVKTRLLHGLFGETVHWEAVGLAALCAEMGDTVHARQYFNQAINDEGRTPSYREKARNIAAQYRLS